MTKEQEEFTRLLKRVKAEFDVMGDEELAALIDKVTREETSNRSNV